MIEKVFLFVKDEFIKFKIHTKLEILDDFELMGIENEFKHIILNIINNSKDAFVEKNLENREIFIKVYEENDEKIIEISDNAGGIDKNIINDIFKANFTNEKRQRQVVSDFI